ncbi:MAG: FecR domain-containing protein [Bacteroidota bacterium]
MNQDHYIDLIAQYLAGEISEQDQNRLMEWVAADAKNQALLDETTQLWEVTEHYDTTFDTNVEIAWHKVESRIDREVSEDDSSASVVRLFHFKTVLQIAAAILLMAVTGWWFSQVSEPQQLVYQTLDEQTLEINLPDSSLVVLNQNSSFTYEQMDGRRVVTLQGEAWFDVMHLDDVPFEIESGAAKTTVLGTAFNVRAYPNENKVEVSVERGKVKLAEKSNDQNVKELPAGTEGILYEKEAAIKVEKVARKNDNANAWRTLVIECEGIELRNLFETMRRVYEVEIEVDNPKILNCDIEGTYRNTPIKELVEIINFAVGLEVEVEGDKYTFSGEGCVAE